jgi:hypothetical protein
MKPIRRAWAAGAAAVWMLALAAVPLRAQDAAGRKIDSFGEGRIIRADGTKIFVKWFNLQTGIDRIEYFDFRQEKQTDPETLFIAFNMIKSAQARERPTFGSVASTALLAGFAGGVASLIAANLWGGPWKETWPGIGLGTAACAAVGTVIGLTIRRYRTVYTNAENSPKPVIKLEMGAVASRTPGLSLSIAY